MVLPQAVHIFRWQNQIDFCNQPKKSSNKKRNLRKFMRKKEARDFTALDIRSRLS